MRAHMHKSNGQTISAWPQNGAKVIMLMGGGVGANRVED